LSFPDAFIFAKGLGFHAVPPLSGVCPTRLWSFRGLHRQSLSPFRPSPAQDRPASLGGHPDEEPMGSLHLRVAEIRQCLFHSL
jgi:hypothetical protein